MRIVIDLQSAQGASKNRGMGRYSLWLAQAMAKVGAHHEIWIALSALFPDTIGEIEGAFQGLVPAEHIAVWQAPGPVAACDPANNWRRRTGELVRESFLASLRPDIVHTSSLFEGFGDDCITSVGRGSESVATGVTLYDLIPLVLEHAYMQDLHVRNWYFQKLQWLKNANLWLAISEHTRQDAIERLGLPEHRVTNISAGCNPDFQPVELTADTERRVRERYGLTRRFLLYTGGIDPRKNIEGMIAAFAMLPRSLRGDYQLVVVCSVQEHDRRRLTELARCRGLRGSDVIFTGFVPDDDLITLYNLCALFVFPSLYEGFGLPPLEAMSCGAPVIASNTSSLPEVVGWEKALFDPKEPEAISEKIREALTDDVFRRSLRKHGLEQAKCFSWEQSARRALEAFEAFPADHATTKCHAVGFSLSKPALAYLSPLPPVRSGIADYSRELLPELAKHYRIELIVDQEEVSDPWLTANFPIRNVAWFAKHGGRYDRILYQFGNSEFHKHMIPLVEKIPGVVVLHDFYLSGVLHWMDHTGHAPGIFRRELYESHGWAGLTLLAEKGNEAAFMEYPCSLGVIEAADGVIVHSQHATELGDHWYGDGTAHDWVVIPHLRRTPPSSDRTSARQELGLGDDDFLICSFGFVAPSKLPELLLEGWLASILAHNPRCSLVFVGHCGDKDLEARLTRRAQQAGARERMRITGYVSREDYERYLTAADMVVQMKARSRGETSGPVLDALAWGRPLVVNAHGWLGELPDRVVLRLPNVVRPADVVEALEKLHDDADLRRHLAMTGPAYVREACDPQRVARSYFEAIERFTRASRHAGCRQLIRSIAQNGAPETPEPDDLVAAASAIAQNLGADARVRQLFFDVSRLRDLEDPKDIQRVPRMLLKSLLQACPRGWRGEPVYASLPYGYRYARAFVTESFDLPSPTLDEGMVEVHPGDVFLGLHLEPEPLSEYAWLLEQFRLNRANVFFVLYDMLPVRYPEWTSPEGCLVFNRWLEAVAQVADGIICISRSVADQTLEWLDAARPLRSTPLKVGFFHLGTDPENACPGRDGGEDCLALEVLARTGPVVLMVGALEPRTHHSQVLAAFEALWRSGSDISLVIVGKQGWRVEPLVERLRNHPEQGKRLLWLEEASDAMLFELYRRSTVLLMASQDEGFGLPLVEAARHGLPIIARSIPVFREVCGDHAFYFTGDKPEDLEEAITTWLKLHQAGKNPSVEGMKVLTWEESTQQLLDVVLGGHWYRTWTPKCGE